MKRRKTAKPGSKLRQLASSRLTLIVGFVLIGIIGYGLVREINQRLSLNNEKRQLEAEIDALEGRNFELASLIDYLNSEAYAEEEARLRLGLQKVGEKVVKIINENEANVGVVGRAGDDTTTDSISTATTPERWWNYFFN